MPKPHNLIVPDHLADKVGMSQTLVLKENDLRYEAQYGANVILVYSELSDKPICVLQHDAPIIEFTELHTAIRYADKHRITYRKD